MFSPAVGEEIEFERNRYFFPPSRPGASLPYEAEGGRATVIRAQKRADNSLWALKVFRPNYRTPRQLEVVKRLEKISGLPGLHAAHQTVITKDSPIVKEHPDLEWAVMMPWVEGDTWSRMLGAVEQRQRSYSQHDVELLAAKILEVLTDLEKRSIVHCDLSRGNVMVKSEAGSSFNVQLVDLEDMLIENNTPASTTPGTDGYALPGVTSTACVEGDRYAGAILIAESLALSLPFDARLLSSEGLFRGNRTDNNAQARFDYVCNQLQPWKPKFVQLLRQAWYAQSLRDCAPLSDILNSLTAIPEYTAAQPTVTEGASRFGAGSLLLPTQGLPNQQAAGAQQPSGTLPPVSGPRWGTPPPQPMGGAQPGQPPFTQNPQANPNAQRAHGQPYNVVPPPPGIPQQVGNTGMPPVGFTPGTSQPYVPSNAPYSPVVAGQQPNFKLYSPASVAFAALLAGPLGGSVTLEINFKKLGQPKQASTSIILGLMLTLALCLLFVLVQGTAPYIAFGSGPCFCPIYGLLAKSSQKDQWARLQGAGVQKASIWAAIGIGLLCDLATIILLVVAVLIHPNQ